MPKMSPPATRGSVVSSLLLELARGPKQRCKLQQVCVSDEAMRQALKRMRDKGWVIDALVLTDSGKKAAHDLAQWVYDDPKKREVPPDHLVEQVRHWKGVRWG